MPDFDSRIDMDTLTLLKFKDFVPGQRGKKSVWTSRRQTEPLRYALEDANAWIIQHPNVEIINVETVVLPNMHTDREEGSVDSDLMIVGGASATWHQFFRIWYLEQKATSDS